MKPKISSQENIIAVAKEHLRHPEAKPLNIRELAQGCGLSVGAIYGYFGSKDALMLSIVSNVWQEIFSNMQYEGASFTDYVQELMHVLDESKQKYPKFIATHMQLLHPDSKADMSRFLKRLKARLAEAMERDARAADSPRKHAILEAAMSAILASFIDDIDKKNLSIIIEHLY